MAQREDMIPAMLGEDSDLPRDAPGANVTCPNPSVETSAAGPPSDTEKVSSTVPVFVTMSENPLPGAPELGVRTTLTPSFTVSFRQGCLNPFARSARLAVLVLEGRDGHEQA